jgi:hypothetical protein
MSEYLKTTHDNNRVEFTVGSCKRETSYGGLEAL